MFPSGPGTNRSILTSFSFFMSSKMQHPGIKGEGAQYCFVCNSLHCMHPDCPSRQEVTSLIVCRWGDSLVGSCLLWTLAPPVLLLCSWFPQINVSIYVCNIETISQLALEVQHGITAADVPSTYSGDRHSVCAEELEM